MKTIKRVHAIEPILNDCRTIKSYSTVLLPSEQRGSSPTMRKARKNDLQKSRDNERWFLWG